MIARLLTLALLLFAAPASAAPSRAPVVLAAASLQEAMDDAAAAWARAGHQRPVVTFAASSALARQIAAGAPGDLFVSADDAWMNVVASQGRVVAGTRAVLARGRLVVVTRGGRRVTGLRGAALARVLAAGPLAMADSAVPAGRYGEAALTRLGAWRAVGPRVVRAENVRATLALVARGAAPYGIVYATDARAEPVVQVAGVFPAWSHPAIVYPIARLSASGEAEAFRRFLLSRAGRTILAKRGFVVR